MPPPTLQQLEKELEHLRRAPRDVGIVEMIVRRPDVDERDVVDEAVLDLEEGVVGDNWRSRGSGTTPDGSPHPAKQLTLMNARCIALVAGQPDRWPLAGDQLYVDFDLSVDHLPAGTKLRIGAAVIEVSADPHTGCGKFARRFGADALRFVNSPEGRRLRLRGMNSRIVEPGTVWTGDRIERV